MLTFYRGGGEVALPLQAPNTFSMERIKGAYRNTIIVCVSFVYANNGTNVALFPVSPLQFLRRLQCGETGNEASTNVSQRWNKLLHWYGSG